MVNVYSNGLRGSPCLNQVRSPVSEVVCPYLSFFIGFRYNPDFCCRWIKKHRRVGDMMREESVLDGTSIKSLLVCFPIRCMDIHLR